MGAYTVLTRAVVAEWLAYDSLTGELRWLKGRGRGAKGRRAGRRTKNGYINVGLFGFVISAHRLAWLLHFGEWPPENLDHRNRQRDDNRIDNLRLLPQQLNAQNRLAARCSRSGLIGASWKSRLGRWAGQIRVNGKQKHLGYFGSAADAHAAYMAAKQRLHAGFTG